MISVLVPTLNRSSFVVRLLQYYKNVGFNGHIIIGDSSDKHHAETIRREVGVLSNSINIRYIDCAGLNDSEAIGYLSQKATTPYVAFAGDDDFIIPNGLNAAVKFLEEHPKYSIAHGTAALCVLKSTGAHGQVESSGMYTLGNLEHPTASQRLINHLSHYFVTLFSVHRTEQHRLAYKYISNLKDKSFTELLPSCIPVLQGHVKQLKSLYLVRQVHDQRYLLPTAFDWITSSDWFPSYEIFQDLLSEELMTQDQIEATEARKVVKQAFNAYLRGQITKGLSQSSSPIKGSARTVASHIPILRKAWQNANSFFPGKGREMSLPSLLRRSSNHRSDFLPVYRAITTRQSEYPN